MSDTAIVITVVLAALVILLLALGLIVWLVPVAARLVLAFTAFLMGLPFLLTILVFILFPPTLVVFLIGIALMQLGVGEDQER
jgi:hypothetical protein